MGYSCCFLESCFQNRFETARSIGGCWLVYLNSILSRSSTLVEVVNYRLPKASWCIRKTENRLSSPSDIRADICLCLSPDMTWHKVNDLKVDYSGDLGEGKVGHEPRLELCKTVLVIDPQCNVGLMSIAGLGSKSGSRHVCLIIA